MKIRIFNTPRFGWCIEIDDPPMWKLIHRIPNLETARAIVAQDYPGITPMVEPLAQPALFAATDQPKKESAKKPKIEECRCLKRS